MYTSAVPFLSTTNRAHIDTLQNVAVRLITGAHYLVNNHSLRGALELNTIQVKSSKKLYLS